LKVIKPITEKVETGKGTLLVVDDEDMILDVSQQMLEKLGYKVLTAKSGKAALEIYAEYKDRIDVIILDMIMRGIGGGETYDRLRKIDPVVNVLLSSGYSMDKKAKDLLERGCKGLFKSRFI